MDTEHFWALIEEARAAAPDASDADDVAARAAVLLAARDPQQILRAQQVFWDLLAASYQAPLWAAAYLINGGCSDDGFEYFRGWLITQGRATFEQVVADTDRLAEVPAVRAAAAEGAELEGEEALGIAWEAYRSATGSDLPPDSFTITYPALDPAGAATIDDPAGTAAALPRLARLYDE